MAKRTSGGSGIKAPGSNTGYEQKGSSKMKTNSMPKNLGDADSGKISAKGYSYGKGSVYGGGKSKKS